MTGRTPVRKRRRGQRRGTERSEEYKAFVRERGCATCPSRYEIEAAHTTVLGPRGLSQRASDFSCIPLCRWCHRFSNHSYHVLGEKKFAIAWKLDIKAIVATLRAEWEERK